MKNLILCLVLCYGAIFSSISIAQETVDDTVHCYEPADIETIRAEYQVAADALLQSERDCTYTDGDCTRVSLDYPYPFVSRYGRFLDQLAEITRHVRWDSEEERRHMIATILAVSWAETAWNSNTNHGLAGECGFLQVISCEAAQRRGMAVACHNGDWRGQARPTCEWLRDLDNSFSWFLSFWKTHNSPARYNGCRSNDCTYVQLYGRRHAAMMEAFNNR